MGQGLKNIGNFYASVFDPAGVVTGKNALERSGLMKMPKGVSLEGLGQVGPTKAWAPQTDAGLALAQPKVKKANVNKQFLGGV